MGYHDYDAVANVTVRFDQPTYLVRGFDGAGVWAERLSCRIYSDGDLARVDARGFKPRQDGTQGKAQIVLTAFNMTDLPEDVQATIKVYALNAARDLARGLTEAFAS